MFKNYLKITWRNLKKNKGYSAINIGGLAVGLAICMLIVLYLAHEFSYNQFHQNFSRLYQAETEIMIGNQAIQMPYMGFAEASAAKQNIPSIEDYLRYKSDTGQPIILNPDSPSLRFVENEFLFADSNFFEFFSFQLFQGDKTRVLLDPFSVVISIKAAEKYFGQEDPIGKIIRYNNEYDFIVSGVAENTPSNSSIEYDFVASISSLVSMENKEFLLTENDPVFSTYLLLKKSANPSLIEDSLLKLYQANGNSDHSERNYNIIPFGLVHLNTQSSNIKYIKIFPFVAALVLLLAIINYASLSTARATRRLKEIGVRKVLGANRVMIAKQFFVESALYTFTAFVFGYLLCVLVRPLFFDFLQIQIDNSFLYNPKMFLSFALLLFITILLAAAYPSLLLTSYKPVMVLHGKLNKQRNGISTRKFFTVFQFTISIILIICGIVMDRQMYFFKNTDTGVDKENVVMIPFSQKVGNHFMPFKQEIQSLPSIMQSSVARYPMYEGYNMFSAQRNNSNEKVSLPVLYVDQHFVSILGLKWKIPPHDSLLYYSERTTALVNEASIEKLNLDLNPISQSINGQYEIQGVLKDFNYLSLHNKIDAVCLLVSKNSNSSAIWAQQGGCLFAKINSHVNMPSVIGQMKEIYEKYDNDKPFEYHFLNETFENQYKAEDRLAKIFSVFTAFTILLAAMGLLGLATFMTEQRRKEIGIRKVLGASTQSILTLLSRALLRLVLLAIVIASPIAWWAITQWLQGFAYRIEVSWWYIALAGTIVLTITLITISYQSIKASVEKPVSSLKDE